MTRNIFLIVFGLFSVFASAERYISHQSGVEINVPVGFANNDLKVSFNEVVKLGVPSGFRDIYRVQLIDKTLYLKARKKSTKSFRLLAKDSQKTYVFNVFQDDKSTNESIVFVSEKKSSLNRKRTNPFNSKSVSEIDLTRYASQKLYAPSYAFEPIDSVQVKPLNIKGDLNWIYKYGGVEIKPIVAFGTNTKTVTALEIKNKSKIEKHTINLQNLVGRVSALMASSQHRYLGTNESDNTSVIYIVTEGSLSDNLLIKGEF